MIRKYSDKFDNFALPGMGNAGEKPKASLPEEFVLDEDTSHWPTDLANYRWSPKALAKSHDNIDRLTMRGKYRPQRKTNEKSSKQETD